MFVGHPDPAPGPYIIKKTLNPYDFFFDFLSLKNDVNVTLKKVISKKTSENVFLWQDPDSKTDPQH
jgi:hypothetical protein